MQKRSMRPTLSPLYELVRSDTANCSFTHRRRVAAYRLSRLNGSLAIASASKYVSKGSAGRSVYRGVDAHPLGRSAGRGVYRGVVLTPTAWLLWALRHARDSRRW